MKPILTIVTVTQFVGGKKPFKVSKSSNTKKEQRLKRTKLKNIYALPI